MPSKLIPTIQYVYIFKSEHERLVSCFEREIGYGGLCCFLYGLRTHSSNVVVHLVVSNDDEFNAAQDNHLDCVGYVAKIYDMHLFKFIQGLTNLSFQKDHVVIDICQRKKAKDPNFFCTNSDLLKEAVDPLKGESLQLRILEDESPFRKLVHSIPRVLSIALKSQNGNVSNFSKEQTFCDTEMSKDETHLKLRAIKNRIDAKLNPEDAAMDNGVIFFNYCDKKFQVRLINECEVMILCAATQDNEKTEKIYRNEKVQTIIDDMKSTSSDNN